MQNHKTLLYRFAGIFVFALAWWLVSYMIANNPDTASFADFGLSPTLSRLWSMLLNGEVLNAILPSFYRIGFGLGLSIVVGVPLGIALGKSIPFQQATHIPFQFIRMISPLAWMPIAILVFDTWDSAIIFLLWVACIWPIAFATFNGYRKMSPMWFKVAKNLGATPWQMIRYITIRAVAQDMLTGFRLALGVAWIILVPAEYLGVSSGLGYAINDARDTLEYDRLAAIVLVIGFCGLILDSICVYFIHRVNWVQQYTTIRSH